MPAAPSLPIIGFEGPEKKLEIDFCGVTGRGLRDISQEDWQLCLNFARCTIIGKQSNDHFDAYLLSESSLMVYGHKVILKTCGTTMLLKTIPKVLEFGSRIGTVVEFVRFCRSNFNFPEEQPFPHSSFEQEVEYLDQFFDGSSYVLGPLNGTRWNVYVADYGAIPYEGEIEQQLEVQMSNLDPEVMKVFFKGDSCLSPAQVTDASGIRGLLPEGSIIDDFVFDPCGYSMNGLFGKSYYTIHITPEAHCSYVSFETNLPLSRYDDLIKQIVATFKPGRFSVSVFADDRAPAGDPDACFNPDIEGFCLKDRTVHKFEGNYFVVSCKYMGGTPDSPTGPAKARKPGFKRSVSLESSSCGHDRVLAVVGEKYDVQRVPRDYKPAEVIAGRIAQHGIEDAFYLVDLGAIVRKYDLWRSCLPRVAPHYALKCNPSAPLLLALKALGCGFDCSSKQEIATVLDAGVSPDRVLFANPCKMATQIKYAKQNGVDLLTFDSDCELQKLHATFSDCRLLLRIAVHTTKSGFKFGASLADCPALLELAKRLSLNIVGVSFHIGGCSNEPCSNPLERWTTALQASRKVFDMAKHLGLPPMTVLDIGGGFPATASALPSFEDVAACISHQLDALFPPDVSVIAEPGRYFAAESHTLAVNVFARRETTIPSADGGTQPKFLYYINDGIYGSFNCLLYDHAKVVPLPVAKRSTGQTHSSTIFGPTCDSLDTVADHVALPELQVGDWLYFPNMGAYTVAASTAFNGFSRPKSYYLHSF